MRLQKRGNECKVECINNEIKSSHLKTSLYTLNLYMVLYIFPKKIIIIKVRIKIKVHMFFSFNCNKFDLVNI